MRWGQDVQAKEPGSSDSKAASAAGAAQLAQPSRGKVDSAPIGSPAAAKPEVGPRATHAMLHGYNAYSAYLLPVQTYWAANTAAAAHLVHVLQIAKLRDEEDTPELKACQAFPQARLYTKACTSCRGQRLLAHPRAQTKLLWRPHPVRRLSAPPSLHLQLRWAARRKR